MIKVTEQDTIAGTMYSATGNATLLGVEAEYSVEQDDALWVYVDAKKFNIADIRRNIRDKYAALKAALQADGFSKQACNSIRYCEHLYLWNVSEGIDTYAICFTGKRLLQELQHAIDKLGNVA